MTNRPTPLTHSRWCLALIGMAILLLFAVVLDACLWLRATDAELLLGVCRHEVKCLEHPNDCR